MLGFYEKKGRKLFFGLVITLVLLLSIILIVNKFIEVTQDEVENQQEDITLNTDQKGFVNGQIEYIEGVVEKRDDENSGWFSATKSDIIKSGTAVRTLADSRAIVTFEDGSAVRLDENTVIVLSSQYGNIAVNMDNGFVYNKVSKNDNREYSVTSGDYTVTALGTEFSVENDGDEIDLMVVESAVDVRNKDKKTIDKIEEGDKARVKDDSVEKEKIEKKDIEDKFIAWNLEKSNKKDIVKEEKKESDDKKDEEKSSEGYIKLSGEKSSSGVRLHWDTVGLNASKGFKIVKSKEKNPVYPGDDYKYLSDPHVRDYKWKISTGKKYYFRVCVYQSNGKCGMYSNNVYLDTPDNSDEKSEKSDDYADKVTLSAEADGDDVKLKWDISGGDAPKGFKIVKSKEKNPVYPGDDYKYISDDDARKYEWKNLKEDKTYYFRVCVYKGGKCGTYSNNEKVSL